MLKKGSGCINLFWTRIIVGTVSLMGLCASSYGMKVWFGFQGKMDIHLLNYIMLGGLVVFMCLCFLLLLASIFGGVKK